MPVDAFYFPDSTPDLSEGFIRAFINSSDFTNNDRLSIAKRLKIVNSDVTKKEILSNQIASYFFELSPSEFNTLSAHLLRRLIGRNKRYLAVKLGRKRTTPQFSDVSQLIKSRGENGTWYGPIIMQNEQDVFWYIRPELFTYIRDVVHEDTGLGKERYTIRWLCFARVAKDNVSIFWRNFSTGGKVGGTLYLKQNEPFTGRFPYWNYIPKYFQELAQHLDTRLEELPLESIILHDVWDSLRYEHNIAWSDERIRAEHQGVSLNASGTLATPYSIQTEDDLRFDEDNSEFDENEEDNSDSSALDISGIRHLASTIVTKIKMRLNEKYEFRIPQQDEQYFDEEVLRTLIQQYNPKSYCCSIRERLSDNKYELLFRADSYFGKVPESSSADKFVHLFLKSSDKLSHIDQLNFILRYIN